MSFIQCERITKIYGTGDSSVQAVASMSFSIDAGDFVAVMGESGSGKSTLLSILGAMNTPTRGRYLVDDIDVYALSGEQQADFRAEYLGFVFQSFHLIPYLSVLENVMLPLAAKAISRREKNAMAMEALSRMGMESKAGRLPHQISGGEMERTAIARAVVNQPPVLLADEPTGNLDSRNAKVVMDLFVGLHRSGTTIIMVTHSAGCAQYAQRVLRVSDGRLSGEEDTLPAAYGMCAN
jgi:putative ABC transport system ATP-binding protein